MVLKSHNEPLSFDLPIQEVLFISNKLKPYVRNIILVLPTIASTCSGFRERLEDYCTVDSGYRSNNSMNFVTSSDQTDCNNYRYSPAN